MAESEKTEKPARQIIGIAIDKSEHAEYAFNFYASYVNRPDHYVVLLHVPDLADAFYASGAAEPSFLDPDLWHDSFTKQKADAVMLKDLYLRKLEDYKIDGEWVTTPGEGKVGDQLVNAIKDNDVNMMVMGCRGLGTLRRTIMGSVSDYVLHHADIPVLVYKRPID